MGTTLRLCWWLYINRPLSGLDGKHGEAQADDQPELLNRDFFVPLVRSEIWQIEMRSKGIPQSIPLVSFHVRVRSKGFWVIRKLCPQPHHRNRDHNLVLSGSYSLYSKWNSHEKWMTQTRVHCTVELHPTQLYYLRPGCTLGHMGCTALKVTLDVISCVIGCVKAWKIVSVARWLATGYSISYARTASPTRLHWVNLIVLWLVVSWICVGLPIRDMVFFFFKKKKQWKQII